MKSFQSRSRLLAALGLVLFLPLSGWSQSFSHDDARDALDHCVEQYKGMAASLPSADRFPKTTSPEDGSLEVCQSWWWVCGFYPGAMWYLYEYTGDDYIRNQAEMRTMAIAPEQWNVGTHDLGFMLYCSFGNGYRLTGQSEYRRIMLKGADSLCTRFHPETGVIQSWESGEQWKYPVIIDNMMNLEFLFWASKVSGDPRYREIALTHANTTIENHFRDDYSSYHVVDYDPQTGAIVKRQTAQGMADDSAWARGQAWGLYGYTMCFREARNERYLRQAKHIADFILNHPNYPEDGIPYWDFDAPGNAPELRDSSAGAIIACALLELSGYVEGEQGKQYKQAGLKILQTLSSEDYLAEVGTNNHFLLKHGVGHLPAKSEVDVPLSYGDYYYVEALMRYLDMREG